MKSILRRPGGIQLTFCLCLMNWLATAAIAAPPVSVGSPQNGALLHPTTLKNSRYLTVRKGRNYGTRSLVGVIEQAIKHVHRSHPETPKLYVGDLSDHDGGHLAKHVSHQSGRDADISYFRDGPLHEEDRLIRTRPQDLDLYRTWTLIAFLLDRPEVQAIYSDTALIKALHVHAQDIGHAPEDIARWFGPKVGSPYSGSKLRHTDGHTTHFHLRVRAGDEHQSWSQVKQTVGHDKWHALKRQTEKQRPFTKPSHRDSLPVAKAVSTPRAQQPQFIRRRARSSSMIKARARAKQARDRARLRAAQARAKRRARTGRVPFQDNHDATSEQRTQPKNQKDAAPKDKRLSKDTRPRIAPDLRGSWFGFGNDA